MIKCTKCGLENLDHVTICVECGNPLIQNDAGSELILYPPRAGRCKYLRLFFYKILRNTGALNTEKSVTIEPHASKSSQVRTETQTNRRPLREVLLDLADFKWALASVIPGVGHLLLKRYYRAFIFFASWLALILFGIMFYGRIISNLCFGCAIAFHASATFDCLPLSLPFFNNIRSRVSMMISIMVITLICYYYVNSIISVRIFGVWLNTTQAEPFFAQGDLLLIKRQSQYRRGDIVFYFDQERWGGRGNVNYYIQEGTFFDRIIGLPGEKIEIMKDKILVNGDYLPEEFYPIHKVAMKPMELILGENEYFIYDSLTPGLNRNPVNILRLHNTVNEDNIRGRAFMIYAPLSRMQFID